MKQLLFHLSFLIISEILKIYGSIKVFTVLLQYSKFKSPALDLRLVTFKQLSLHLNAYNFGSIQNTKNKIIENRIIWKAYSKKLKNFLYHLKPNYLPKKSHYCFLDELSH
ncbi:hypothetical protein BpHYR1_008299 [Brachionus plicatilis]|uniref:Uncharacterized protein n=1 Tax=Brachionus plicatilis TaxID=10195 RepID=A0A3M7RZB3_BRAPC|nr:hypothetical protein BpHYR1_008299 [Brachionus plicatilis]